MMEMSVEEIKAFWRGYCERRKLGEDIIARGERIIEQDPEHWADQTMDQLLKLISN